MSSILYTKYKESRKLVYKTLDNVRIMCYTMFSNQTHRRNTMKYIDEKFEYEEFPPNSGTELVSQETYFAAAAEYVLNNPGLPGFKTADERFRKGMITALN